MFELLTFTILVVSLAGIIGALALSRDTLHPLVFLSPMIVFMYVLLPLAAMADNSSFGRVDHRQADFAQTVHLCGSTALIAASLLGSRKTTLINLGRRARLYLMRVRSSELLGCALTFGAVALALYVFGLSNRGGLLSAYSGPKGGGDADSGYLRDFTLLSVPATGFLFWALRGRKLTIQLVIVCFVVLFPLLGHGLLSARRGPTFIGLVTIGCAWHLARGSRPAVWMVLSSACLVGVLLLGLVTFRGDIYLGSDFFSVRRPTASEMVTSIIDRSTRASPGQEFIYAASVLDDARGEADHFWGKRYLAYLLVRPVPSAIWPTKYEDSGLESLLVNAGALGENAVTSRWFTPGAAQGLFADLFIEFRWLSVLASALIGWLFTAVWQRAVARQGIWSIVHLVFLSLSVYLITQGVEPFLVRALEMLLPAWFAWTVIRRSPKRRPYSFRQRGIAHAGDVRFTPRQLDAWLPGR